MAHKVAARSGGNDGARPDGAGAVAIKRASEGGFEPATVELAHQLGPAITGEFPGAAFPLGTVRLVIVRQITPGTWLRLAMWENRARARFRTLSVDLAAIMSKDRQ